MEQYKALIGDKLKNLLGKPEQELIDDYVNILIFRNIRKKQFISQPGFPRRHETYIIKGAFRAFFIDADGNERTTQFAIDGSYINDLLSYLTGESPTLYIEALEDSIIADIPREKFEALCDKYPALQKLYRITAQTGFAYAQQRMISNLQKSAEERYLDFHKNFLEVELRVPQYALASYLNMSQEYLSKIKSKLASSKTKKM